jgi:hypothetical protein
VTGLPPPGSCAVTVTLPVVSSVWWRGSMMICVGVPPARVEVDRAPAAAPSGVIVRPLSVIVPVATSLVSLAPRPRVKQPIGTLRPTSWKVIALQASVADVSPPEAPVSPPTPSLPVAAWLPNGTATMLASVAVPSPSWAITKPPPSPATPMSSSLTDVCVGWIGVPSAAQPLPLGADWFRTIPVFVSPR